MFADVYAKLKVKDGMDLLILNAPEAYLTVPDELQVSVTIDIQPKADRYPFVQLFTKNRQELQAWAEKAVQFLEEGGLLWICYPKKSSSLYEDLSRDEGWEAITTFGLEGVSLISVDDTWSAMRFRPQSAAPEKKKRTARVQSFEKVEPKEHEIPEELAEKLKLDSEAADFFENLAASYKRIYLEWVTGSKREETRNKRMNEMIKKLKSGYKNPYAK